MKIRLWNQGVMAALIIAFLSGCSSAKVTQSKSYGNAPGTPPPIIYVQDFELQVENIEKENGLLPHIGVVGAVRRHLGGEPSDPAELASKLVNLMGDSIAKDLKKKGLVAARLAPGAPTPTSGWLVRGVFTEVQEGNQVRRAVIGLGSGATDLQVVTGIDDLSAGPPKPLYEVDTAATSGKAPGAAATIMLSPFAVPVRYVMAGKDLDKNVKKTAEKVVGEICGRVGVK